MNTILILIYGSLAILATLSVLFAVHVTRAHATMRMKVQDDLGAFDFEPDTADDGLLDMTVGHGLRPLTFPDHAIYPPRISKKPCCGPHDAIDHYIERESGE